ANIVREEAAKYGATTESSLFNESAKRDYDVQGNGYEFRLLQIKFATLNITGYCFLLQKVLDLPAGQLPPEPPIWPTTSTPH
ncbi:LppA family lipoprotein, partial [Mycobacterium tuberculosis]